MRFVWLLVQTIFRPDFQKLIFVKSIFQSAWQSVGLLLALGLGWCSLAGSAEAVLLYTADNSGTVIVQSRRTLRDQDHFSWQVIAFKPIGADTREGPLALRLVGFPGAVELERDPAKLLSLERPQIEVSLADLSGEIPAAIPQPHVGQYSLEALSSLPASRLQLQVTARSRPVELAVSSTLLEEWQTVANTHYADLVRACDRFPAEARQNPQFPAWVDCRMGE